MQHLYIIEDGSLFQKKGQEPSDEDMDQVTEGTLLIVRFHGNEFQELQADGTWETIKTPS